MSALMTCDDCGAPLIESGMLAGRCPSCLLELAIDDHDHAESALTDATALSVSIAPGNFVETRILGGRYRLLRLLGQGGQGEVWHTFDLKLRVEVALKAIRPERIRDTRARESLRREVRLARQVVSPHVCRVFDLIIEDGHEMVSMEFVDGTTLAELLRERGPLDFSQAGEIAAQLLAGLEAIHAAGLVHGDVKPENIMLTLSRRVVLMDFGIARGLAETAAGTVTGTPGYMSPEQAAGLALDARADVFSAAIVLAEMVSPLARGVQGRGRLCEALRQDPSRAPEGPWGAVLRRALAHAPESRYSSAGALARALEIEQQQKRREDETPYPGLPYFTERNARFFFGRELEVELLLRRLRRPRLRAVIGPSGAGKSSFLRAGLVPALPSGWSALVCTPTAAPFASLMRTLATQVSEEPAAPPRPLASEDPSATVLLARRWREHHEHALLIVDQAEELFTLSGVDVQQRVATLLARLVLEADVHVLLSLRDDFLLHCQFHEALHPVFSELVPLTPPIGEALRRALVQPALISGYRFEDERLIDEILKDVARERGSLPLMAFAMARLWRHRDRGRGLLTRRAYEEIGGIGGALTQHAEVVLETIGPTGVPIVREILRNLVTAHGTRRVQGWDELLSAFGERRGDAEEVLSRLVEARLLTSFEGVPEDGNAGRQVEIIHESLLTAWPRFVRWRDQDAESAHLRDQLRQAAHLWDARGRPSELLWTSSLFGEYLVWKERYSGRLTALEREFGSSMEAGARRRRFRLRFGIANAFAALLVMLAVVGQLWLRSRAAEREAVVQARRAEAQQLLALGQVEQDTDPTLAFAYALAALEREDSPDVRRFAVRQLWKGPLAFVASEEGNSGASSLAFSPDGEWLADSGRDVRLWRRDGAGPLLAGTSARGELSAHFGADAEKLVIFGDRRTRGSGIHVLSLPDLRELERIETDEVLTAVRGDRLISVIRSAPDARPQFVTRSLAAPGIRRRLGFLPPRLTWTGVNAAGDGFLLSYAEESHVLAATLEAGASGQRPVARTNAPVTRFWLAHDGKRIAVLDEAGGLQVSSLSETRQPRLLPRQSINREQRVNDVAFAPDGHWVAAAVERLGGQMWDLLGPSDAAALLLGRGRVTATTSTAFDPSGRWLAIDDLGGLTFWPLTRRWPAVLRVSDDQPRDVAFAPYGRWVAAASRYGGVEVWPLVDDERPHRVFVRGRQVSTLAVSPDGQLLATGTRGSVLVLPLSGAAMTEFRGFESFVWAVAFDATGSRIAAAGRVSGQRNEIVRVFDLQTGHTRDFDPGDEKDIASVAFLSDGGLLTSSFGGLRRFDLQTGASELLLAQPGLAVVGPDSRHLLLLQTENPNFPAGTASVYDLQERRAWALTSHGNQVSLMAWDPSGTRVVTGSRDGIVRVGPMTGQEPHLLIGHEAPIWGVRVDSTGRLVASASEDGTVRIWPMPDGQPLHTWPREQLLDKLRSLTNVRIVPDASVAAGYRTALMPFQGWRRQPPTW